MMLHYEACNSDVTVIIKLYMDTTLFWFSVECSKEDVTRTMYTGGSRSTQSTLPADDVASTKSTTSDDKVDYVCEAVKSAVQKIDADR